MAEAQIASSTLSNDAVEGCLVRQVQHWKFPQPRGGGLVKVRYPFVFQSAH